MQNNYIELYNKYKKKYLKLKNLTGGYIQPDKDDPEVVIDDPEVDIDNPEVDIDDEKDNNKDNDYSLLNYLNKLTTKKINNEFSIKILFWLVCLYGGIEDVNLATHYLMYYLFTTHKDKIEYWIYFNCDKQYIFLDNDFIKNLIINRIINIILFNNLLDLSNSTIENINAEYITFINKYLQHYNEYLQQLISDFEISYNLLNTIIIEMLEKHLLPSTNPNAQKIKTDSNCHYIYDMNIDNNDSNTSIFSHVFLNNFLPKTKSLRFFFNKHPDYENYLLGNHHIFGGRLPTYFVDNEDIKYFIDIVMNMLSIFKYSQDNNCDINDDKCIIDYLILYIKYRNQTHNMFKNWKDFFDSKFIALKSLYGISEVDGKHNKIYSESNLRSALYFFSDCREHSNILCILYTTYQMIKFYDLFESVENLNFLNIEENVKKLILTKHMRIGGNRVYINTNIDKSEYRPLFGTQNIVVPLLDIKDLEYRERYKNDTIILNSEILYDIKGNIRKQKNCQLYNCIQLVNEGDHVLCYLYNYDNLNIIIKDALYSQIYNYNLPDDHTYWFSPHDIFINNNKIFNYGGRLLYLVNIKEGGLFVFFELLNFSCMDIYTKSNTTTLQSDPIKLFENNSTDKPLTTMKWFGKTFDIYSEDYEFNFKNIKNLEFKNYDYIINKYRKEFDNKKKILDMKLSSKQISIISKQKQLINKKLPITLQRAHTIANITYYDMHNTEYLYLSLPEIISLYNLKHHKKSL